MNREAGSPSVKRQGQISDSHNLKSTVKDSKKRKRSEISYVKALRILLKLYLKGKRWDAFYPNSLKEKKHRNNRLGRYSSLW